MNKTRSNHPPADFTKTLLSRIVEEAVIDEADWFTDKERKETCAPGIRHNPEEILQRNAQFLIESSKHISSYDPSVLSAMQESYDSGNFRRVVELAYSHDRMTRPSKEPNDPEESPLRDFISDLITLLEE